MPVYNAIKIYLIKHIHCLAILLNQNDIIKTKHDTK